MQAADIKGLVLSNNLLIVDSNCSNSQADYSSPVYLVNVTKLSGNQPTVVANKASTATLSTFQILQKNLIYPEAEAWAPAPDADMSVFPTQAPEPADSSFGGTD